MKKFLEGLLNTFIFGIAICFIIYFLATVASIGWHWGEIITERLFGAAVKIISFLS